MTGRVRTYRRQRLTAGLWVVLVGAAGGAAAQPTVVPTLPGGTPVSAAFRDRATGSAVPLEGVVDSDAYTVGPGDVFAFSIGGRIPFEQRATVTADGMLIVPEVGSFRVAGRQLTGVRAELRSALRRRYANVDSDAALAEPRRFVVHVSGAVTTPGRHAVVPVARLEDALSEAMGESPHVAMRRMYAERAPVLPALRNVEIVHADGSSESRDLLYYYATGDTDSNPYLRDGDVIHVPSFTRTGSAVFVEDRFGDPFPYDYREGDTALDLLVIARGREWSRGVGGLRVLRLSPGGAVSAIELDEGALARGEAGEVTLMPMDRIRVVEPNREVARVEAVGAVLYPGYYSVESGRTTLRQLVELAGGLAPDALARAAYLERRGSGWPTAESETRFRPRLADIDAEERVRYIEAQTYEATRLSGLPYESRQYLAREMLTFQRASLDVPAILAGRAPDEPLIEGDRLIVPVDPGGVFVVGQVERPGFVRYRAGADAEAYIAEAGGRGPAATETYLRDAAGGAVRPARGAEILSGDVLFVDREAAAFSESQQSLLIQRQQFEAQMRRDRAEVRNRLITTTLGVIGTLLSAVALYTTLERTQ